MKLYITFASPTMSRLIANSFLRNVIWFWKPRAMLGVNKLLRKEEMWIAREVEGCYKVLEMGQCCKIEREIE
jgi:hypothetical protein